ncbi:MAG: SAM-dependent methyltransferase [Thiobacillus sp. 65-29]|jgi:chemotaxis protein methyltransferase CheR|nr:MAG: SAM-dependent methyltransferase [Thiobacillus sp. 65-29]
MQASALSDQDFGEFQRLLYRLAGISLSPAKKALVCGRLAKRLKHHSLDSYRDYLRLLTSGREPEELQTALDLLTTNETYFFREPKHFEFLQQILAERRPGAPFRVWSAACSSGEEPFSIAMLLADRLGEAPWEILASDISTRVLERARSGLYAMERAQHIPQRYLKEYCLRGVGSQAGRFLIDRRLRARVNFRQINLNETLPQLGEFDVVFLRNVMIYFDTDTKARVVQRIAATLKRGAHLLIGHSESLNGVTDALAVVRPSVYRKQAG